MKGLIFFKPYFFILKNDHAKMVWLTRNGGKDLNFPVKENSRLH
jgi:hypothetical protein